MRAAVVALAALTLGGCEGGGDPVESALRETAAANHAAVTKETVDTAPVSDPDSAVVARLLTVERQALAAAEAAVLRANDPAVRRLAAASRDAHRARIAELEAWRPAA